MKKLILLIGLITSLSALAGDRELLQQRLNKINGFYATFSQDVKTADNEQVQQGTGEIWVKRPYYFNWTMNEPDVTSIISNGKTMWIYMPAVEQVTILDLKKAVDNRLLLLITDSNNPVWNSYQVSHRINTFTLTATDGSNKNFVISVLPTGVITDFTIIEEDGQRSFYSLSNQKQAIVNMSKFNFTPPKGVTIDDQR